MMGKTVRKMRANIQFWPSYKLINLLKIVLKLHLNFDTSKLGQILDQGYVYEGQVLKILNVMSSKGE